MKYHLLVALIFCMGCGDNGDDGGAGGTGAGSGTGASGGTGAGGGGATEPCDFMKPQVVELGKTITSDLPSAQCSGGLHFYRFTPASAGVYSIAKSGVGNLGFCDTEDGDGCICGVNINCCAECTLTFDLPDDSPLPAGSNNQIYIDPSGASGAYTFTVTGPN